MACTLQRRYLVRWAPTCAALSLLTVGCCETRTQVVVPEPSQVSWETLGYDPADTTWLARHVVRDPDGALRYRPWARDDPDVLVTSKGVITASDLFGEDSADLFGPQLQVHKWVRRPDPGHRWSAIARFSLTTPWPNVTNLTQTRAPVRFWGIALTTLGAATAFMSGARISDGRSPSDRAAGIAFAIPAASLIAVGLWHLLAPARDITVPRPHE